ncbi:hypothetical protein NEOLEDRAFT_212625 [Neolentinus lepideus HHB14362 ss-1]|uniref:Uncharacterized protein n=1 Tax=Neolentinus lepideus HHB14362 ss-1 TaxID=1314782 RepID=A0A165TKT2_9AGAM|nr:hypothetical protein NEOLEDRAFT_212625 [Neolentinus lepideus HHB14362 ss-1]
MCAINVGVLCQRKSFGCQVSHNRQCRSPPLLFILSMKLCTSYSLIPKASLIPANVVLYRFSSFSHQYLHLLSHRIAIACIHHVLYLSIQIHTGCIVLPVINCSSSFLLADHDDQHIN